MRFTRKAQCSKNHGNPWFCRVRLGLADVWWGGKCRRWRAPRQAQSEIGPCVRPDVRSVVVADLLNAPVGRSGGEAAAAARWSGSLDRPCDDQVGLSHAGRCVPSDTTDTFLVTATPPHSPARTAPHDICSPPETTARTSPPPVRVEV